MCSHLRNYKTSCAVILAIGLLSCAVGNAGREGGYGGGYGGGSYNSERNHDNNDNYNRGNYNNDGERNVETPAVVIGVPDANTTSCSTVQQCDAYGNCSQNQVCN